MALLLEEFPKLKEKEERPYSSGPRRIRMEISAGDKAAIARQGALERKRAAEAVQGSYSSITDQEAVPVGRTLRETAQLIRDSERERMEASRIGDTDTLANDFLVSIGAEPGRKRQPEPEKKSAVAKVISFFKNLGG